MRILVTGAEGTLGRVLVRELRSRGHDVWGCDLAHTADTKITRADVAEWRQIDRLTRAVKPEAIYHLAAEFGRANGQEFYEQLWKTNCLGTRNVIECCLAHGSKLIFASSSEAYGMADEYAPEGAEKFEEEWLDDFGPDFHNEYALTKWANERQIRTAAKNNGLKAINLRFFNGYGPGEYYTPYRSVVCLFAYRLMFGLPITVYRGYRRVFMWVGDWARTAANVCERFDYVTEQLPGVPTFNLGGEEVESVENLKDRIVRLLGGTRSEISYLDAEKANVVSKRPNNDLSKMFLGHDPRVTLDEGLPLTIDWMRQIYSEYGRVRVTGAALQQKSSA